MTENVPIFREQVTLGPNRSTEGAAPSPLAMPGQAILSDADVPLPDADEPLPDADLPFPEADEIERIECDGPDAPVFEEPARRSMSRKALIDEMNSTVHQMSHYPHNPLCSTCVRAHLKSKRYTHKPGEKSDYSLAEPRVPMQ